MFSFACLENTSFHISSEHTNLGLSCSPGGHVFTTSNRQEWEKWSYQPTKDSFVFVKSIQHGRFLTMKEDGTITTSEDANNEGTEWMLKSTSPVDGSFEFESKEYKLLLTCNDKGHLYGSNDIISTKWDIEFESGELLFVYSLISHNCMKCDPYGKISMTKEKKGWEVWRFIQLGNGNILISSWTHKTKYLCCNPDGHVYTTENRHDNSTKWSVLKPPHRNGVIIQSVEHKSFLSFTNQGPCTTKDDSESVLWDFKPGNSQIYFISSLFHDRRVGTNNDGPFSTTD